MFISAETLDGALLELYPKLLARTDDTVRATRGAFVEEIGVLIEITNSRARLSRSETRGKLFSSLGELIWYLSGSNKLDAIRPYVPQYKEEAEDGIVFGGYGPRIFGQIDQIQSVIELLRERPTSRRAVIQIFDKTDIATATPRKEIPCTIALQFFVRDEKLAAIATMRSNDAYWGLPHDVFCFTMLQEIIARSLGYDVGPYRHFAGSLHIYDKYWEDAQHFVDERYQRRIAMPSMPIGDPWPAIAAIIQAEERIRTGEHFDLSELGGLNEYWLDLIRIVQIFFTKADRSTATSIAEQITFKTYRPYIMGRLQPTPKTKTKAT